MRARRWLATALAALALPSAGGCDPDVIVGYAGSDAAVHPPEVTWPSSMHPSNELQGFIDYADWRQRPLDFVHVYPDRFSWNGLVQPGWPIDMLEPFPGELVLSQPLFPELQDNSVSECAAGAYEVEWRKLGEFLVDRGRGDSTIRLGWGFNDPAKEWRVGADPAQWVTCFRRIVDAIRSTGPDVQIDWSINSNASQWPASGNPYDAYPGDAYVDIIGMDVFDAFPAVHTEAEWDARCDEIFGLCTMLAFARAHAKRAAVGEWSVTSCGDDPGGDNPFFVEKMFETFAANADVLAYESYFHDRDAGVCSTIVDGGQNPAAAARYRQLFGAR